MYICKGALCRNCRVIRQKRESRQKKGKAMKAENTSSPVLISWVRRSAEPRPAQRDSGMSNCGVGVPGILRSLGILGWKTKSKNIPPQRYSKMSNLKTCPYRPCCSYRPLDFKISTVQRNSKMCAPSEANVDKPANPARTKPNQQFGTEPGT
jgi:hypothetical protein